MMAKVDASSDRGAQGSSAPSLHDLYLAHRLSLVRLASLLLHDLGDAEEVVQDAFVAAYKRWDRVREPERALAYLRSAVLNGARSRLRHRGVVARWTLPSAGRAPAVEDAVVVDEQRERIIVALQTLPTRQRECLVLRYYLELSESEIAATLGISAGSVKTHSHRALATLAQRLEVEAQ